MMKNTTCRMSEAREKAGGNERKDKGKEWRWRERKGRDMGGSKGKDRMSET